MKIQIDNKPFSVTNYYGGIYIKDVGDELEYKEESYEFTIIESDNFIDITWTGYTPDNYEELKEQIIKQFQQII
jgi:hypothetical protein